MQRHLIVLLLFHFGLLSILIDLYISEGMEGCVPFKIGVQDLVGIR